MATTVYFLCALTSGVCAAMLYREYRRKGTRLLLWSSLSFMGMAASNAFAFTDFVIVPDIDLAVFRVGIACVAIAPLVYGLVWDVE